MYIANFLKFLPYFMNIALNGLWLLVDAGCIDSFMVNISFKAVFKINFACRF